MPDYKIISEYLGEVLRSQCFSKSAINRELLRYLVEKTFKGENPKESQIAIDVFGKKIDTEKEFNVRIYIHNLRKKLGEYYLREGKNDEVRFEIPKGSYVVLFRRNRKVFLSRVVNRYSPAVLVMGLLLLLASVWMVSRSGRSEFSGQFIWKDFLKDDYPVLMVLGDHYFFRMEPKEGLPGSIRNAMINSDDDLDRYISENPEMMEQIRKTTQTYINSQAPYGLYKIMTILGGGQSRVEMKYASNLRWEDMKNHHLIFVGSYKTQNILREANVNMGIDYRVRETKLYYSCADSTHIFNNHSDQYITYEYATVSYFQTPDGRRVLFFMCDSDVGNIATLKFLTEKETLNMLKKRVNRQGLTNFKAVFEVKGKQHTEFETNLVRVDPILRRISEIWP